MESAGDKTSIPSSSNSLETGEVDRDKLAPGNSEAEKEKRAEVSGKLHDEENESDESDNSTRGKIPVFFVPPDQIISSQESSDEDWVPSPKEKTDGVDSKSDEVVEEGDEEEEVEEVEEEEESDDEEDEDWVPKPKKHRKSKKHSKRREKERKDKKKLKDPLEIEANDGEDKDDGIKVEGDDPSLAKRKLEQDSETPWAKILAVASGGQPTRSDNAEETMDGFQGNPAPNRRVAVLASQTDVVDITSASDNEEDKDNIENINPDEDDVVENTGPFIVVEDESSSDEDVEEVDDQEEDEGEDGNEDKDEEEDEEEKEEEDDDDIQVLV